MEKITRALVLESIAPDEKPKKNEKKNEERVYDRTEVTKTLESFGVPSNKFPEILFIGDVVGIETFTEEDASGIEAEFLGITYAAERKGAARPKYTIIKTPSEKGAQFRYLRPSKPGNLGHMI